MLSKRSFWCGVPEYQGMFGPCASVVGQFVLIEFGILLLLLVGGVIFWLYYRRRQLHGAEFHDRLMEEIPLVSPYQAMTYQ